MTNSITICQAVLSDIDALVPMFDSYRQFYGRSTDSISARKFLMNRFDKGESIHKLLWATDLLN